MQLIDGLGGVNEVVSGLIASHDVPSASWALVHGGSVASHGATGLAKASSTETVTPETVYEAASLTKPVFAYVVHTLIDQGLIDPDRSISDLLTHDLFDRDQRARLITPRHVLTHTSGLPNWRTHTEGEVRTHFEPGSWFSYSGEGFVLLQRLVEHVLSADLETITQERLFRPIGMTHSTLIWPSGGALTACAPHNDFGEPLDKASRPHPDAASTLHTTAHDLALFMCKLIQDKSVLDRMLTPFGPISTSMSHHENWPDLDSPLDEKVLWGHGIGLELSPQGTNFWQWGDNSGWKAFFVGCAEHGDGAVILTNSDRGRPIFAPFLSAVSRSDHPSLEWLELI